MSQQYFGFYFSSSADGSANDKTVYAEMQTDGLVKLAIRYKNSDPNHLYEAELDSDDLEILGRQMIQLGRLIKRAVLS